MLLDHVRRQIHFACQLSLTLKQSLIAALVLAIAGASPYPPEVTVSVPAPTGTPFFGNKNGNFQPNSSTSLNGVHVDATGGQVSNGNVAVTSINNNDGIGAGSDTYKQYNGDGTTGAGWPAKSKWVSFVDMSVICHIFEGSGADILKVQQQ